MQILEARRNSSSDYDDKVVEKVDWAQRLRQSLGPVLFLDYLLENRTHRSQKRFAAPNWRSSPLDALLVWKYTQGCKRGTSQFIWKMARYQPDSCSDLNAYPARSQARFWKGSYLADSANACYSRLGFAPLRLTLRVVPHTKILQACHWIASNAAAVQNDWKRYQRCCEGIFSEGRSRDSCIAQYAHRDYEIILLEGCIWQKHKALFTLYLWQLRKSLCDDEHAWSELHLSRLFLEDLHTPW